jgi:glycerol-3-phosphate acyltransferase PlsX
LLARGAFNVLREKMDPRKMNGGLFLGLNGLVIKSHGGTDAEGIAAALDLGYDVAHHELVRHIAGNIARSESGLRTVERVAS